VENSQRTCGFGKKGNPERQVSEKTQITDFVETEMEKDFRAAWSTDLSLKPVPADLYEIIVEPEEEGSLTNVPISLSVSVIAAYIFIGAVFFSVSNEWSLLKGAYFSFVTLSTIGETAPSTV